MKWTVLVDNRTNNPSLETEHGLSILLETEKHSILLDTGASDVFIRNAERLGKDLSTVDYVFVSHGHSDHAGGLKHFMQINKKAKVIVSPDAISGRFFSKRGNLHSMTTEWPEIGDDRLILIDQTREIAKGLHLIAHIPQIHPMPKGNLNLYVQDAHGEYIHDDFRHEQALYIEGLLFTGCAHSGLENILDACPWPVHTVVGGFHLLDGQETEEEINALGQRLKALYPHTQFYTSHCTGDAVFVFLQGVMGNKIHPFSCGTTIYNMTDNISLVPITPDDKEQFILDNQRAFKYGAQEEMTEQREQSRTCSSYAESRRNSSTAQFGMRDDRMEEGEEVISRKTIERCMNGERAETYRIVCDGNVVGGLILQIDQQHAKGELEILFVNPEAHSKGIGQAAWKAVEAMHPEIRVWETITPYFEKRNIHFYVNRLGFHIVEFWNKYQHGPAVPEDIDENWSEDDEMFLFRKIIQ
jgi:7,8-dihydropterin-6-yl-methyl-4-(beta-D-ribofuranosyl)aminobenzene 5'-phosphate synthase